MHLPAARQPATLATGARATSGVLHNGSQLGVAKLTRRRGYDYARQMFQRAIEIDPTYARAHAGVAYCHCYLYMYWEATAANLREAETASRRALELDPQLAEGHVARGLAVSLSKQFDEGRIEFETTLRLDPKLFEAYYF